MRTRLMTIASALALLLVGTPIQAWDSESADKKGCTKETANTAACLGELPQRVAVDEEDEVEGGAESGGVAESGADEDGDCIDNHAKCVEWADLGECGEYRDFDFAGPCHEMHVVT